MPQVVACSQCHGQFMAADHVSGTIAACPNCGAASAIPHAAPLVASPAPAALGAPYMPAPSGGTGTRINDLINKLPTDRRGRERTIGMGIVIAAGALWLLVILPSLPFL
ncbi:MAG: hypothetical protein WD847_00130 [Pirellulales bacterium]